MAFRTFADPSGREWEVYDVVPPADERRRRDRRGESEPAMADRRGSDDRRLSVGRLTHIVTAAPEGWLCFESGADRRRLSPIPENWTQSNEAELEVYRQLALAVPQLPASARETPSGGKKV